MTKAECTKAKIINEAAYLFRKKGYAASTLREIAKRCGIEGGSIYFHFGSKQEILLTIMEEVMDELTSQVNEGLASESDPLEKLRTAIAIHIKYHIDKLDKTYATDSDIRSLTNENYNLIVTKRRAYENIFIKILEEGIGKKIFRKLDAKMTTFSILQMCTGVSYWFKEDEILSIDEITERYFNFICGGVRGSCRE